YCGLGADLGEHRVSPSEHLTSLDEPALRRKRSETQILGDRQIGAERQLLVNHADACGECVARSRERDFTSVDKQATAVRLVDPCENFSERALSGAVLAAQ